jgi:hypothetical protein
MMALDTSLSQQAIDALERALGEADPIERMVRMDEAIRLHRLALDSARRAEEDCDGGERRGEAVREAGHGRLRL